MSGHAMQLGAVECPETLVRFLTEDELGELERIASRSMNRPQELERAGRIVWMARRRAEMRHPGFE
jgi:hypothetical protein